MAKPRPANRRLANAMTVDLHPKGVGGEPTLALHSLAHVLPALRLLLGGDRPADFDPLRPGAP